MPTLNWIGKEAVIKHHKEVPFRLLEPVAELSCSPRPQAGEGSGDGLYCGEQFFGIVFDGQLYFKANPDTVPEYLAYHAAVFAPSDKQILKNYREVPADILEDSEILLTWARKAAR